jgi:hypothetical protein
MTRTKPNFAKLPKIANLSMRAGQADDRVQHGGHSGGLSASTETPYHAARLSCLEGAVGNECDRKAGHVALPRSGP